MWTAGYRSFGFEFETHCCHDWPCGMSYELWKRYMYF